MNEKKKDIIETASGLFAKKGFYSTSIQEIADKSAVSKGTVYLNFRSKDELLLRTFQYHHDKLREKVLQTEKEELGPADKLTKQLYVHFMGIVEHKEFIIMLLREQAISMNDDIRQFIGKMRLETQAWHEKNLIAIYGKEIKPYIYDIGTMLDGMISAFLQILIIDNVPLNLSHLSSFIVEQCDSLAQGILTKGKSPMLTMEIVSPIFAQFQSKEENSKTEVTDELLNMQRILGECHLPSDKTEELHATIDLLLVEIKKPDPRKFVFQGMLANFKGINKLDKHRERIATRLNIDLI